MESEGSGYTLMISPSALAAILNLALKFISSQTIPLEFGNLKGMLLFQLNGTSGATIVQIQGAAHGNTTCLLRIYDGNMRFYSNALVDGTNLYDKWFRVNLIHDVDRGMVTVFIDGVQKFQTHDQGPGVLYFKCGVYGAPTNISYYMESRWRDIKLYKK